MKRPALVKDKFIKKIIKNSGIIFLGNSAASGLGIVSFTLMANALGPELLAYFALSQAYVRVMNDLFNIQTWESMLKFGSVEGNREENANIIKTNFFLDCLSALTAFFLSMLLLGSVSSFLGWSDSLVGITSIYVWVIPFTITTFTIGIPRLYDKFFQISKVQFSVAVFKLCAVALLYFNEGSARQFVLVYALSEILSSIILIGYSNVLLNREAGLRWWKADFHLDMKQVRFVWWTNLRTIVRIPVRHLDVVLINLVMSVQAVGVYKVYKEIVEVINRLSDPLNQALYPEYTKLIGIGKSEDAVNVTGKLLVILTSVCLAAVVLLLFLAEGIVSVFFGTEYLTMIPALYALIVLSGFSLFLTPINSLFIAAGFARYSFFLVLVANGAYLLVAYVAGTLFGIYGIVLAFAIQMVINKGFKIILLRKYSAGWSHVIR